MVCSSFGVQKIFEKFSKKSKLLVPKYVYVLKSWILALISILEHLGTIWLHDFFKIQYVLQNGVSWKGWNLKTSHFPCTVIYFLEVVIVYEHFTKWKGCSMFLLADMTEVLTQKRSSCQLALYCICIYKKNDLDFSLNIS